MSLKALHIGYAIRGRQLLEGVTLELLPGELVVLLGPNGAGKSTLLRVLSGELHPQSGQVTLDGASVHAASLPWLAGRRAVMSQSSQVVFDFSVEEVLEMGWAPNHWLGEQTRLHALTRVTQWCDLGPLLGRQFNSLSGGEQQRAQFARALMQVWPAVEHADGDDRYLFLDEPTASLDLSHELLLMRRLAKLVRGARLGAVTVLHDLNLAARFADRIILLTGGRLAGEGSPQEVLESALLSDVYEVPVHVQRLDALDRLVVTT